MWELEAYEISPNKPIHRFALSDDSIGMTDFYGTRFCIIEPNAAMPPEIIHKRVWLMACAPELLAALEEAVGALEFIEEWGDRRGHADRERCIGMAWRAIAKASGGSHGKAS